HTFSSLRPVRDLLLYPERNALHTAEDPDPVYAPRDPALPAGHETDVCRPPLPPSALAFCRSDPGQPFMVQPASVPVDHGRTRDPLLSVCDRTFSESGTDKKRPALHSYASYSPGRDVLYHGRQRRLGI